MTKSVHPFSISAIMERMKCPDAACLLSLKPLPPLVLITRGDPFDREVLLEKLELGKGIAAEGLSPKALSEYLTSTSLFSAQTTLVIRHITKLDTACQKILLTYAKDPSPSLTLVCEGESTSSPLCASFEEGGVHLDLGHLPPWEKEKECTKWLTQESEGRLSPALAGLMVERVGVDKRILKGELDKCLCYLGTRPSLTKDDLEALLVGSVASSVWELGRAIMGNDAKRALRILASMGEGLGLFGTLSALRFQMQTGFLCASYAAKGVSFPEMQKALPKLKGRQLERMVELAKGYGIPRFQKALLTLNELEGRAKRQMLPERLALEVMVAKLAELGESRGRGSRLESDQDPLP